MLGWIYAILFVLQVVWLVWACHKRKRVGLVLVGNLIFVALSLFLLWYFDTLPGYGLFPGFAFFPEVFASLCAAVAFAVLTLVTAVIALIRKK